MSSRLDADFFKSSQEAVSDIGDDSKILAGGKRRHRKLIKHAHNY